MNGPLPSFLAGVSRGSLFSRGHVSMPFPSIHQSSPQDHFRLASTCPQVAPDQLSYVEPFWFLLSNVPTCCFMISSN